MTSCTRVSRQIAYKYKHVAKYYHLLYIITASLNSSRYSTHSPCTHIIANSQGTWWKREMARTDNKKGKTVSAQQNCGRLPGWILGWMYTNALICTWDASFIMFRPHSLPGGAYSWIWYFCKYRFLFFPI